MTSEVNDNTHFVTGISIKDVIHSLENDLINYLNGFVTAK